MLLGVIQLLRSHRLWEKDWELFQGKPLQIYYFN